jgi:hypothetical protein
VRFSDESGSVVLEFVGFGLILRVPILMFVTTLLGLQHDQFAAEAITRDALRSYVLLGKPPIETATEVSQAYRVPMSRVSMVVSCRPHDCEAGDSWVEITTKVGAVTARGVIHQ